MPSIARDAARELVVIPWDVVRLGVRRLAAVPTRVRSLAGRRDDAGVWDVAR